MQIVHILEDEQDIAELVAINLHKSGYATRIFNRADDFISNLRKNMPDLLILDLMLPDMDGLEVCKYLRSKNEYSSLPIIMLTAKSDELDKIIGLELGADDYVPKPFSPRELVARVKAVLRRETKSDDETRKRINEILEFDPRKHEVYVSGVRIEITTTEFKILALLLSRIGWVFSRHQILEVIDPEDKGILDRTVDVHIKNLREKLIDAGKHIRNIRGIGYKFEE
jgi:DNA-binding response OmpR family regulator